MSMAMELSRLSPRNWFRHEESLRPAAGQSQELMPMSRLHRDIDRWFEDFMSDFGFPQLGGLTRWPQGPTVFRPHLDVIEGEKAYTLTVEIPGVDRNDIQLELRDGTLVIAGEKKRENREENGQAYRVERSYGRFERMLTLPEDAEPEKIEAKFTNGVLTVTVPRNASSKNSKGRKIEISTS